MWLCVYVFVCVCICVHVACMCIIMDAVAAWACDSIISVNYLYFYTC